MKFESLSDFYQHAVFAVYGVVIALSFEIAGDLIVPIQELKTYEQAIDVAILSLAYLIIVTSWVGYFISIKYGKKYGNDIYSMARFALDLVIVFIFYYMVVLTEEENSTYRADVLGVILPVIFGVFLIWDAIKLLQIYREKEGQMKVASQVLRMKITLDYFLIFLLIGGFYSIIHGLTMPQNEYYCLFKLETSSNDILVEGFGLRDPFFIALSAFFILKYRYRKWKYQRRRKSRLKRTKTAKSGQIFDENA